MKEAAAVVEALMQSGARKATLYVSPTQTVKGSRPAFKSDKKRGRFADARKTHIEILLTFGQPNYEEREFIRRCKKAGEPFPIKKLQLKFLPSRKK